MRRTAGLTLLVFLFCATPASATLVYQRVDSKDGAASHVIVAAKSDGSEPHVVAHGFAPVVSPIGRQIAFFVPRGESDDLHVVRSDGTHDRLLVRDVFAVDRPIAWSSDGRYLVVADPGHVFGAYLIDLIAHKKRQIATDSDFGAASFKPDAHRFVLAEVGSASDFLLALRVGSREQRRLGDGNFPVWGRPGIAYGLGHKVLLRKPDKDDVRVIHRARSSRFYPVGWSSDGKVLLVDKVTAGSTGPLLLRPKSGRVTRVPVSGFVSRALSQDGQLILGEQQQDVVTARPDGTIRVLATHATNPSWDH